MDKYIITYRGSKERGLLIHPDWIALAERATKDAVIRGLKKHLWEPGEYTAEFLGWKGFLESRKINSYFLVSVMKGTSVYTPAMTVYLDYYDDTLDSYDFRNTWPEIDCEKEIVNPTAIFTVSQEMFDPSPKELEIQCQKAYERFLNNLHKWVNCPLEIECLDYPDVVFEICYEGKPDEDLIAKTGKVIEDYVEKYNKKHSEPIHDVAEVGDIITDRKENAVYIHVDFGNCNIDALGLVMKAIGKSNLDIKEMKIR